MLIHKMCGFITTCGFIGNMYPWNTKEVVFRKLLLPVPSALAFKPLSLVYPNSQHICIFSPNNFTKTFVGMFLKIINHYFGFNWEIYKLSKASKVALFKTFSVRGLITMYEW